MKNQIIAVLKDDSLSPIEKYNQLLGFLAQVGGIAAVRTFQTGYSPIKYDRLVYQIRNNFGITDLELHEYNEEKQELTQEGNTIEETTGKQSLSEVQEHQAIIQDLQANSDATEGLKLRDEYSFLKDKNCPNAIKILIADKMTAWESFASAHACLQVITGVDIEAEGLSEEEIEKTKVAFESMSEEDKEEFIYQIAKDAVANYALNEDIKKELDYYKETGKVLGDHPALAEIKIQQEIEELETEAELVEMIKKAEKNAKQAEREIEQKGNTDARALRVKNWKLRQDLATERKEHLFPKEK